MIPEEKQDGQAGSSGPAVAFPLSFPLRPTSCTRWGRTWLSFQSPRHRISAARPSPPCAHRRHSSLLHLHSKTPELSPEHAARNGSCQHCGFHNLLLLQLCSLFAPCASICGSMLCSRGCTCIYMSCYPPPKAQGNDRPGKR